MCLIVCFLAKRWKNKVANVTEERSDGDLIKTHGEDGRTCLAVGANLSYCNLNNHPPKVHVPPSENQSNRALDTEKKLFHNPSFLSKIAQSGSEVTVENDLKKNELGHSLAFEGDKRGDVGRVSRCFSSPGLVPLHEGFMDGVICNSAVPVDLVAPERLENTTGVTTLHHDGQKLQLPPDAGLETDRRFDLLQHSDDATKKINEVYYSAAGVVKYIETSVESSGLSLAAFNIPEDAGEAVTCNSVTLKRKCKTWSTFCQLPKDFHRKEADYRPEAGRDMNIFTENLGTSSKHKDTEREGSEGEPTGGLEVCVEYQQSKYSNSENEQPCFSCIKDVNSTSDGDTGYQLSVNLQDETLDLKVSSSSSPCQLGNKSLKVKHMDDVFVTSQFQNGGVGVDDALQDTKHGPPQTRLSVDRDDASTRKSKKPNRSLPLLHVALEKEKFWKYHTNCCDEFQPCPTATRALKRLKILPTEPPTVKSNPGPPADKDLLEEKISLPYLPSNYNKNNILQKPGLDKKKNYVSLPDLNVFRDKQSQRSIQLVTVGLVKSTDNLNVNHVMKEESVSETQDLQSICDSLASIEDVPSISTCPAETNEIDPNAYSIADLLAPVTSTEGLKSLENMADDETELVVEATSLLNNRKLSRVAFLDNNIKSETELGDDIEPYKSPNPTSQEALYGNTSSEHIHVNCKRVSYNLGNMVPHDDSRVINMGICETQGHHNELVGFGDCVDGLQPEDGEDIEFAIGETKSILDGQLLHPRDCSTSLLQMKPPDYVSTIHEKLSRTWEDNFDSTEDQESCNINVPISNDDVTSNTIRTVKSKNADQESYKISKTLEKCNQRQPELVDHRTQKRGDANKTNQLWKVVPRLNPLEKDNQVDLRDYLSTKSSKTPYQSVFSMLTKVSEQGTCEENGKNTKTLELESSESDPKTLRIPYYLDEFCTQRGVKFNHSNFIGGKRMDSLEYVNYLYNRKLKPFRDWFGRVENVDRENNDLGVLSNLHFCKVAKGLQFGVRPPETAPNLPESDPEPNGASLNPGQGYLPPTKEELGADSELAVLNMLSTLKQRLALSTVCNEEDPSL